MTFDEMDLDPRIHHILREDGFEQPTPIQEQGIPPALEGRDLVGIAQTGTGKTLSFVLPGLTRIAQGELRRNHMLVLTPTRELANQVYGVADHFGRAMGLNVTSIYGGVNMQPQIDALSHGTHVIVATPGRLLDHMSRGRIRFDDLVLLVLDEADRMLDMGFLPDITRIVRQLPSNRQTIMCSATWPDEIARMTKSMMHEPERISVGAISKPVDKVRQVLYTIFPEDKQKLLLHLIEKENIDSGIIFMRTKQRCERVYKALRSKKIDACVIHGDRSQSQRQQALDGFRDGTHKFLVATDVAARGIDIDTISHVINYDIPENPDDYIHRIGRTARADAEGDAITFVCPQEHEPLSGIERALNKHLPRGEWERLAPVISTFQPSNGVRRKRTQRRFLRRR